MLCLLKAAALQGDEKGLTCYSSCAHCARMKPFPLREFVSRRECVSRALEKVELRFLDALLGGLYNNPCIHGTERTSYMESRVKNVLLDSPLY